MKQKKDCSMLYAVLAGACCFAILICAWSWLTRNYNAPDTIYPSGSVVSEIDTFGGFPAYGIDMEIVQIPLDQSDEFVRQLQENGMEETPLPEDLHYTLESAPDTRMLSEIPNGLWWFRNDSAYDGGMLAGRYTNFTFTIYDIDACVYYHTKNDSQPCGLCAGRGKDGSDREKFDRPCTGGFEGSNYHYGSHPIRCV